MTNVQGICRRVKTDIEGCLAIVDKIGDELLIRNLGNEPSCLKFFVKCHVFPPDFYRSKYPELISIRCHAVVQMKKLPAPILNVKIKGRGA